MNRLINRESTKSLGRPAKKCRMKQDSTAMAGSAVNASPCKLKSMVSYKEIRPTAVKTSLAWSEEATLMIEEPVVPTAPKHALSDEQGEGFFPSPRSVLERRSSSGSFF